MLTLAIVSDSGVELVYMVSALFFVLGIKRLSRVRTARSGNALSALGMGIAIAATAFLLFGELAWMILGVGIVLGTLLGLVLAKKVPMTAMPELVAFFNGLGGGASMLVALAEVTRARGEVLEGLGAGESLAAVSTSLFAVAVAVSVLIGAVTLTGSLVAYGKLSGKIRKSRIGPLGSQGLNALLAIGVVACAIWAGFSAGPEATVLSFGLLTLLSALLGVGLVVAIGGADMPVVISLLNSYSGLAAAATGFALENNLLIIAGSLVGASGLILTRIMCKAMNRSLTNVLFGGFGETAAASSGSDEYTNVKSTSAEEVAMILEGATSMVVVPGYGMAVAQAQHKVRELGDLMIARGCKVSYGIHPVAGRMPGHMNVLLAEADVPYEQLYDLDQINGEFKNTDLVLVIGANDVCNPAASDPASPIAGMPVLDVWDAQSVIVIKRSLSPGYAGIKNGLFERDNALMFFGDGKQAIEDLITEVKEL